MGFKGHDDMMRTDKEWTLYLTNDYCDLIKLQFWYVDSSSVVRLETPDQWKKVNTHSVDVVVGQCAIKKCHVWYNYLHLDLSVGKHMT